MLLNCDLWDCFPPKVCVNRKDHVAISKTPYHWDEVFCREVRDSGPLLGV